MLFQFRVPPRALLGCDSSALAQPSPSVSTESSAGLRKSPLGAPLLRAASSQESFAVPASQSRVGGGPAGLDAASSASLPFTASQASLWLSLSVSSSVSISSPNWYVPLLLASSQSG